MDKEKILSKKSILSTKVTWILTKHGVLVAFILLIIVFSIISPYFFQISNILNIGLAMAIGLMLAAGETVTLICGLPDLSVASTLAFTSMVVALLLSFNINYILAIIITLLVGAAIGYLNGIVTTKLNVIPLITTLGTMAIFRGLAYIVTDGESVSYFNKNFENLGRGHIFNIPIPIIASIILCFIIYLFLKFTVLGQRIYAVGGNSEIAQLFGINTDKIKTIAFVISGITASLGGIFITAKMKTGAPVVGLNMELPVITAVILGGTSLTGGVGGIWGTLLGIAFLSTLSNGFTLTYVSSYWQMVVRGLVLIGAVALDVIRRQKR